MQPSPPPSALQAQHIAAKLQQAVAFHQKGQLGPAHALYQEILTLQPAHFDALHLLGVIAAQVGNHAEALAWIDRALAVHEASAAAHSNRGHALNDLKQHEAALRSYDRAIELQPDFPAAHWNQGLCYLQLGDFGKGWPKHEWRWKNESTSAFRERRDFPVPLWLGEASLQGKTILLHAEQGLGDTIQFCRYAPLVRDLGARVILEVQPPLMGLLSTLDGVSQLIARGDSLPAVDFHCPLLSLPLALKTGLASVPLPKGYLHADPAKVAVWQKRLGVRTQPRVGLVWSGSAAHKNDRFRSIPLPVLMSFLDEGCQYISLQKELRAADMQALPAWPGLLQVTDLLTDFTETAALCELLDVVITVDTSVAHLAAAMGKPTWLLLPSPAEWRWMMDRNDSPWYASMKLYRQPNPGDWVSVMNRVREDLKTLARDA
ncbi:MAG: tetratricopeptide repeat protein [Polaromonas sp.]|nr:tetratricopeptide repeat protein [Polaromonas sp.]